MLFLPALAVVVPLVVPPALAGLVALRPKAAWTAWADRLAGIVVLGCGLTLLAVVPGRSPVTAFDGVLRADALSAFLLTTVGAVAVVALWGSSARPAGGRFAALVALFLAAMSLAVLRPDDGDQPGQGRTLEGEQPDRGNQAAAPHLRHGGQEHDPGGDADELGDQS